MPAVEVRTSTDSPTTTSSSPLPSVLQTPSGLAIVEIQGTIQGAFHNQSQSDTAGSASPHSKAHHIGRLEFPLYNPQAPNDDGKWMKKVYLYVGKHQRLTGEVKKLAKPLAVIRKVDPPAANDQNDGQGAGRHGKEVLEIMDVVKFKVLFSSRPEPVGE